LHKACSVHNLNEAILAVPSPPWPHGGPPDGDGAREEKRFPVSSVPCAARLRGRPTNPPPQIRQVADVFLLLRQTRPAQRPLLSPVSLPLSPREVCSAPGPVSQPAAPSRKMNNVPMRSWKTLYYVMLSSRSHFKPKCSSSYAFSGTREHVTRLGEES